MGDRVVAGFLGLAFALVGGFAWALQLRPPLEVNAQSLTGLPPELEQWHSQDVPLEETVELMLRADANVQREYVSPRGERVWLYVGYYGTARGGRPEHTPSVCYPAYGWRIERQETVAISIAQGLRATEYLAEKDGQRDLVQFWYRSYRRTGMLGGFDVGLDHFLGPLLTGRADGALTRISTTLQGDEETVARGRLLAFAIALDAQLAAHWPTETSAGS